MTNKDKKRGFYMTLWLTPELSEEIEAVLPAIRKRRSLFEDMTRSKAMRYLMKLGLDRFAAEGDSDPHRVSRIC